MRAALIIAFVWSGAALGADPKPAECPAGTEKSEMPGVRGDHLEFCKDIKSGSQQGVSRLFDSKNRLMLEIVNDAGRETSRAYTAAGVARYIDDVNASKRDAKLPWRYTIVNPQTLRYVVTANPFDEPLDEQAVRRTLSKEEPCLLMRLPGATFQKLEMRMQRAGGKVWFKADFTLDDCAQR